jgi:ABC-type multidrug transport system fused ATPase/permease subunit
VIDNLRAFLVGRTAIVISHRIAAVRGCDDILVLDQGRVVERGRHADLVRCGGLYARLDSLQHAEEAAGGTA